MKLMASGAMVALLLGLITGWAEHPRAATAPVMEGPRIIVDRASETSSAT